MTRTTRTVGVALAAVVVAGVCATLVWADQIHRNGFETREIGWVKGEADVAFRELVHEITDLTSHSPQHSEHLQVAGEQGSYIYYHYPTARAPLVEELGISLYVRANRPNVQLLARLVLPKERNPNNLDEPLTTLLRGDFYQQTSRWQRLEVRRPVKLAKQQQQLMRAQYKRDLDFTDAYVDRLLLNVYCGPGFTDVWIDDLEIGPVVESTPAPSPARPTSARPVKLLNPGAAPRASARATLVELDRGQLRVDGKQYFFRGIRHSDTPLKALRDAGFNTVWMGYGTAPALVDEAVSLGFLVVPSLPTPENDPRAATPEALKQEIARFRERDQVLFWDVGGGLTDEQASQIAQTVQLVRSADSQRPVGADAWDGLRPYSRTLDLLGVHRWPLQTGLELPRFRDWLDQRFLLARDDAFLWTWVQTHLPDWYTALVYDRSSLSGFDEPVGPQPEQIRLLTYIALGTGCRGLGFWSDRFLADSHQGRDRLLTLAILNQEIKMLEPLLVTARRPEWIDTSLPDVKAAVLRSPRGVLVLPVYMGKGAQFVPGQGAAVNLSITVPQVPAGTQAWEITPGDVRALDAPRVPGGTRVTLPEFDLTSAIVFTSDNGPNGIVVRSQNLSREASQLVAQWSIYLAEEELTKVTRVQEQLEKAGHPQPDGRKLLEKSRELFKKAVESWNKNLYRDANAEAQRAMRPLRILMRAQWNEAVKEVGDLAVASPYAVSFYTLPRHWALMGMVRQGKVGGNVLPQGGFEVAPGAALDSWLPQETTLDDVELIARRVPEGAKEGSQCLMLEIKPKNPQAAPVALERTFLAINSPVVRLQPGTLVKVSGWIKIPQPITASADGALFYDSAGGEPLAVRLTDATKGWQQFTLYRWVPPTGMMNVTLALSGLGAVYFDDIRIEPLLSQTMQPSLVSRVKEPAGK